ncbi:MAG: hypothetical protein AB7G75_09270 [Candidatus Binatia bacterium]
MESLRDNPKTEKYRYGKTVAEVTNAGGVRGFLLYSAIDESFFFRAYHENGEFTDYDIRHHDLEVTIAPDALASFYKFNEHLILDHSPEVLGLEKVEE